MARELVELGKLCYAGNKVVVSALTVTFLCYFSSNLSLNSSCSNKALDSSVFSIVYIAVLPVLVFKHQDWASGQERCHESFYYART